MILGIHHIAIGVADIEAGLAFYRDALGETFTSYISRIKHAEWERYLLTVSEWEQREYFSLF